MYIMSTDIKKSIERIVGLSLDEIRTMSADEERVHVAKLHTKPLRFSCRKRKSIYGRGNPLLAKKKYRTIEYVDQKIAEIKPGKF